MAFSVEMANMVTLFVAPVGYGINLVAFFSCMRVLLLSNGHLKSIQTIPYIMTTTSLAMFSIATFDVAVILDRSIDVFVDGGEDPGLFVGVSNWWSVAEVSNLVAQTFIGDAILIYRCYVIWDRRWFIIVGPAITCLTGTGCGIAATVVGATSFQTTNKGAIFPFMTCLLSLTLATNITTSFFIVLYIWNVHRKSLPYRTGQAMHDPLTRAIRVTIESGLLYTASTLVLLITYCAAHQSQVIVGRALVQIIGITFNLVIGQSAKQRNFLVFATAVPVVPLEPMTINQEIVVSHDPPDNPSISNYGGGRGRRTGMGRIQSQSREKEKGRRLW